MQIWHRVIHPITQHFRQRRGRFVLEQFPDIRSLRICDLGGSVHFWDKLGLDVPKRNITIYNISRDETQGLGGQGSDDIAVLLYDGKHIPVPDKSFDLLVCNSVLEHVPVEDRAALVQEMRRVARAIFCQTPAWSFPIEPHFLMPCVHWLPRWLGYQFVKLSPWRLLSRPSQETMQEYWWGTRLLGRREMERLFPTERIVAERFAGLTKSYYVVGLAGRDATAHPVVQQRSAVPSA